MESINYTLFGTGLMKNACWGVLGWIVLYILLVLIFNVLPSDSIFMKTIGGMLFLGIFFGMIVNLVFRYETCWPGRNALVEESEE